MEINQSVKSFYDKEVNRKIEDFIYTNKRVEFAWATINEYFKSLKPNYVLEIGCGIGSISWRISTKYKNCHVIGHDISNNSIQTANALFSSRNLEFILTDNLKDITKNKDIKFDAILLIDVYEHIPIKNRLEFHEFVSANLASDGILFMSCPTPRQLLYLRNNKPKEIQPIDEEIELETLLNLTKTTNLNIELYKEINVWNRGDYFHVILSNRNNMEPVVSLNKFEKFCDIKFVRIFLKIVNFISLIKVFSYIEINKRKSFVKKRLR